MKKANLLLVSLAALLFGSAGATDLRIYQEFSEVRTPLSAQGNTLTVDLPDSVWDGIVPGSLDLEGLSYTQAVQRRQGSWLSGLEGKEVTLREGDKTEKVTLVRAADLLIKDAQGNYRNVKFEQLAFAVRPPLGAQSPHQSLVYTLERGGSGTLSYLTRQLTWTPRYTLRASGSAATLIAQADIRNDSDQSYDVSATELFSGDVSLEGLRFNSYNFAADAQAAPAPMAAAVRTPAPKLGALGGVSGLYRYGLNRAFTLPANSTYTLPFAAPQLTTFERYAGLNTYFSTQNQDGTLSRFYRLKADQNLPGGQLTVREDGRISGQTALLSTAKGSPIEFNLGRDPDMRYSRAVETLSSAKGSTTYKVKVTYTFENAKDRVTRAEVRERIDGRRVVVSGAVQSAQGTYLLKVDIPARGEVSKSFTVTIENGQ